MTIDARESADSGLDLMEIQRQARAVGDLVRQMEALPEAARGQFVQTNLGEYPFARDGSSSYILYHVKPDNGNAYFNLQGSTKPDLEVGPDGVMSAIEADFTSSNTDPSFAVRRGILASHLTLSEKSGQQIVPGSASAIEVTLDVLNAPAGV